MTLSQKGFILNNLQDGEDSGKVQPPLELLVFPTRTPLLAIALVICLSTAEWSLAGPESASALLDQGTKAENSGALAQAVSFYSEALKKDGQFLPAMESLRRAERKIRQRLRLHDAEYRKLVLQLRTSQALDLYQHVTGILSMSYVDGRKSQPSELYRHGLDELEYFLRVGSALEPVLGKIDPQAQIKLLEKLVEFRQREAREPGEIRENLLSLASVVRDSGWASNSSRAATMAILECAQGACHGLDEFTLLLSPTVKNELEWELQGKQGGVGIALAQTQGRYEITKVQPGSPAEEAGLAPGDLILAINGQAAAMLSPAKARGHLVGLPGSELSLQVHVQGMNMTSTLKLKRKLLPALTVDWEVHSGMAGETIGLARISSFNENTPQDLKEAMGAMQMEGVHGLILDMRGNPGGNFGSAIATAEIFLGQGTVAMGESRDPVFNRSFTISSRNPYALPLVILVDKETASAAEMLALALQEHGRAKVAGTKTRGKNSLQCLIPLEKTPWDKHSGGVQVTVARLRSPAGHGFERGITPDFNVDGDAATVLAAGKMELLRLLNKAPGKMPVEMK